MTDPVCRLLRIAGRVQGVGFRAWLAGEARELGLSGWVRNRRDGTVEALLAGPAAALDRLPALCREGPPLARVTSVAVETTDTSPTGLPDEVEIRPTT